jgi:hypothetical protein
LARASSPATPVHLEDATPIDFAERLADVLGGFAPSPGFA